VYQTVKFCNREYLFFGNGEIIMRSIGDLRKDADAKTIFIALIIVIVLAVAAIGILGSTTPSDEDQGGGR